MTDDLRPTIAEIESNLANHLTVDSACVRWLLGKYKEAQAIVEKLPKTADGVPVTPKQTIYFTFGATLCEATSFMELGWPVHQLYSPTSISRCYSTREAAEQARKEASDE